MILKPPWRLKPPSGIETAYSMFSCIEAAMETETTQCD